MCRSPLKNWDVIKDQAGALLCHCNLKEMQYQRNEHLQDDGVEFSVPLISPKPEGVFRTCSDF